MYIRCACPKCRQKLEVASSAGAAPFNCPACGESIKLPHDGPGPGTTIGGFRIERLIGIGGMGEVYLAKQLSMDRDVALKILPGRFLTEQEVVDRFLNEARLLARLEHPNIVTAHEAGQDRGVLFMAMAYVKGEPMDRKIDRDGPLPERVALPLVRKVAAALAYAWNEHRMLHRDIKPANILLDVNGEPKLADLGLSRRATFGAGDADEGTILGTPNYMSPEQVEGHRKPDFRSDMYSLGATLYHILTGQLPFAATDVQETLRKQVEESLPDPRVFRKDISSGCVELLTKVLAKDPDERPASWESFMGSIDHLLGQRPQVRVRLSRKGGESPDDISGERSVRRTVIAGAGVLLLLAALALYFVIRIPSRDERRKPDVPGPVPEVADPAGPDDAKVETPVAPEPPKVVPPPVSAEQEKRWADLSRRFEAALALTGENPFRAEEARRMMGALQVEAKGSPLEPVFLEKHAEWEKALAAEREREGQALRQKAREAVSEPAMLQTIQTLQTYKGPFPNETAALRESLLRELNQRLENLRRENRELASRQLFDDSCRQTAQRVLQSDLAGAATLLEGVAARSEIGAERAGVLQEIRTAIQAAELWPSWIIESFRKDIGQTVVLNLASGDESWEIREITGDRIRARKAVGEGFLNRDLTLNDLSLKERYRRLGLDPAPERELLRGMISLQAGRLPDALKNFEAFHPVLGPLLIEEAKLQVVRGQDSAAEKAFGDLMRQFGIQATGKTSLELASVVRRRRFTELEISAAKQAVTRYRNQYGSIGFAQSQESVLVELEAAATVAREVEPAEVEARLEALRRANPQTGEFRCRQERSPRGLKLHLAGNPDLSSLQALEGLPIVQLDLSDSRVRDLSALRGMPLRELNLNGTPVSDLEALEDLPLERLSLNACPVSDLAPLAKLPLQDLSIASTRIATLQPLRGKALRRLVLRDTGVSTLRPLAGMPLEELNLQGCGKIETLEPLRGAPLTRLVINGTQVRDLEPLTGMPLEVFEAAHSQITRLQGLEKAPLNRVVLAATPVSDLSPLAECPVATLVLRYSKVADLAVLEGWPVEELDLEGLPIRDLAPLMKCPRLRLLVLPNRQAEWRSILGHPELRQVGFSWDGLRPVKEFWNPRGAPVEETP